MPFNSNRRNGLTTLALTLSMLLTSASCMALRCRDSSTNGIHNNTINAAAITSLAQNLPDNTVHWISPELQLDVTCDSDNSVGQDEYLHIYLDPERQRGNLPGIEVGIFYQGSIYWGTDIIRSSHQYLFGRGPQRFPFRYRILLRKRPFSGNPRINFPYYELLRIDSIYTTSLNNYRHRITDLNDIRFVECSPVLPGHSNNNYNYFGTAPRGVTTGGGGLYQAGFDIRYWSGTLHRRTLAADAYGRLDISWATGIWEANQIDNERDQRRIYTSVRHDDPASQTKVFAWDTLNTAQQTLFHTHPIGGWSDNLGRERVAYLRGSRQLEERGIYDRNRFRFRLNLLGDIVNSSVQYVGPPSGLLAERHAARRPAVYVGANDGMLHAFDADTGAELFAYVPRMLIGKLPALTMAGYSHQAYVDGAITAAEVPVAGSSLWRTALVAGLGAGAPGAIALDISNPGDFASTGGVLWEFGNDDDADMGYVTGAPQIASFRFGSDAQGRPQQRHFAILASGPRNVHRSDANGPGVLFLLALDKPVTRWVEGENYFKLKTPSPTLQLDGDALAAPGIALAPDGTVKALYAGDLQGNLWHFDFSAVGSLQNLAQVTPAHLFTATDARGRRQAISTRPQIVHAPHGGFLALFGSGRLIDNADLDRRSFAPQTFYAVRDSGRDVDLNRSHLAARNVTPVSRDGINGVMITGAAPAYQNDAQFGWYVDFPEARSLGERLIYDPLVVQKQLFFNTLSTGAEACTAITGRSYRLDVLTGISSTITGTSNANYFNSLFGMPIAYVTRRYDNSPGQISILAATNITRGYPSAQILHRFDAASSNTATAGRGVKSWNWKEIPDWRNTRRPTLKGKSP